MRFHDRSEAGRVLSARLEEFRGTSALVLALPRGGVPVGWEIARALKLPLEVWVTRKIAAPQDPALGIGAVAEDGTLYVDRALLDSLGLDESFAFHEAEREAAIAQRRARVLRRNAPAPDVEGRTVILVDDGVATGGTIRAAATSLRRRGASRIVAAVPVAQAGVLDELRSEVDGIVCLQPVHWVGAIGAWYEDFGQVTDEEVLALLEDARESPRPVEASPGRPPGHDEYVRLALPDAALEGELTVPEHAHGLVLFAHGSGSSRASPRNRYVARILNGAGLSTLLFDLLTRQEEARDAMTGELRFNVELLARRLTAVTQRVSRWPQFAHTPIGYFGASTGAAAALIAAAEAPDRVAAVVSRGGRPDLAMPWLAQVRCATLFIVGGADEQVLELNRRAMAHLTCACELSIIEDATHLFEEPGALDEVARLSARWFSIHLAAAEVRAGV